MLNVAKADHVSLTHISPRCNGNSKKGKLRYITGAYHGEGNSRVEAPQPFMLVDRTSYPPDALLAQARSPVNLHSRPYRVHRMRGEARLQIRGSKFVGSIAIRATPKDGGVYVLKINIPRRQRYRSPRHATADSIEGHECSEGEQVGCAAALTRAAHC